MSLRNILNRKLVSCQRNEMISQVARRMKDENIGSVVVVEDEKPVGIVTDRDIALRCVAEELDCSSTAVETIMTKGVETVGLDEGIFNVVQVMKLNEIRRVPVVDEEGKAVGVLSFGDVFDLVGRELGALTVPATPENPKIVDDAA